MCKITKVNRDYISFGYLNGKILANDVCLECMSINIFEKNSDMLS